MKMVTHPSARVLTPSNVYGCALSKNVFVGPFCEIQEGVFVGENSRISSHSFVCSGVHIGQDVFIGHGVVFVNDLFDSENIKSWIMRKACVEDNVRIGSNATILPVCIGHHSIIGAGSVVTKDIPAYSVVVGNPARIVRKLEP